MGRMVSLKVREMKDMLQSPTPESRIVDQATSPSLDSPDWGLNLRIFSLINAGELSGGEVVKSIKRKISAGDGDPKVQRMALELLEACAMNCEKIFSEIASEKLVEEMVVRLIENPQADKECQVRAIELIRAWGETEDLHYLPVFWQTYENLKRRGMPSEVEDGTLPPMQYSLESYLDEQPLYTSESHPIADSNGASGASVPYDYGSLSAEQTKEFLEVTKNSLEVLSSLLSSTAEPSVTEDDLTISMVDKCKDSQVVLQRIVQTTADDEGLLFEALNLNDELQKVISKFEEIKVSVKSDTQNPDDLPKESSSSDAHSPPLIEAVDVDKSPESPKGGSDKSDAPNLLSEGAEKSSSINKHESN